MGDFEVNKKENRYRDQQIIVRVSKNEKEKIVRNMNCYGISTMTNYIRLMALNGRVIHIDFSSLKESLNETSAYLYELQKIGNNINQIAHKLNQTDIVETEDVQFLVSEFSKMQKNYERSQTILLQEIKKITRSK